MANLTGTPTYSNTLRQLETTDPKHPDTWNPNYQKLLNNDTYLKQFADDVEGSRFGRPSLAQVINEILNSLGNIAGQASAVSVQRAVGLDWLYRNRRIAFELFTAGYNLQNHLGVSVASGVMGDDSLDIADTSGVRVGEDYLLADATDTALARVTAILSGTRLRLASNLSRNWGATARLTGSTLAARSGGGVDAAAGAQWVSCVINLGEDNLPRSVIIRRSLNAGEVRLYFRDAYTPAWTERPWSVRRSGGGTSGIPDGFADYEYIVPLRGDGYIRLLVDGETQIIHHVVGMGAATGLGGFVNPLMKPAAPTITAPANAATNVVETPTLTASNYVSPAGNAFATAQFQISASNTFATILHDSGEKQALTYSVPAGVLAVNTTFYLRSRFKDVAGLVSDWSAVTSFTTKATYAYVATPLVTSPTNGQLDVTEQPTFQSSAFAAVGGNDTHASSQWQIRLGANTWATVLHDSGASATAKTSYTVPAGVLQAGQTQYVMRMRHVGTTNGASEWSSDVAFTTKQSFATIMGIVLAATGAGGTWQRVDGNFNAISTTAATFNNHPTYAGVIAQTIDRQAMVKVPKFYVRTGTVPSGTYTGKKYWMISDQPAAGFSVHPAFMNAGAEIAQYWVGKYQGTADGSAKLGSAAGVNPLSGIDITTMKARAEARNVSGVSGFQLWNIYQLSAIQLLALLEMGGSDSQALVGSGNSGALSATDNSVVAQATWRGIVGLWGNIAQAVDGIRTNGANQYEVWDISGNKTWQSTGLATPSGASYIVDTYNTSGANYNMAMLFAPSSSSVTYSNATYPDAFYATAGCIATNGRQYNPAQDHGLFALGFQTVAAATTDGWGQPLGGRLAKV